MKTNGFLTLIIGLVFLPVYHAMATTKTCRPLLWPTSSAIINPSFPIPQETILEMQKWSNKLLTIPPHPVVVLGSAGKTDINDKNLMASREAFKDADKAAVLALTYQLTHNVDYFNKTLEILLSWSNVNQPTGNPIDETRLEGLLWAYDLIACDVSAKDKTQLLNWIERLRAKKVAWKFGEITRTNNHRIHQLKMLLMTDKLLQRFDDWESDIKSAEKYTKINLNPKTGVSVDYLERSALYYHNYVMQPWLEISLMTGCCWQPVKQAFTLLSDKILTHHIEGEFSNSQAKIDKLRGQGGFVYAKKGGTFDVTKAAPTIVMYYTIDTAKPNTKLWTIQQQSKPSPWMAFLKARRILWQP